MRIIVSTLGALLLLGSMSVWAQQDSQQTPQAGDQTTTAPPDNTKKNARDRQSSEATADQQKETQTDRDLARQIRRALVQDKSLSTYAHNVKVIAQNGTVTLKGPVKSEEEKQAIAAKAAEVAGGADKVVNEIEVTTNHQ